MAGIKRVDFGFFDVLTKTLKTTSMKLLTRTISFQKCLHVSLEDVGLILLERSSDARLNRHLVVNFCLKKLFLTEIDVRPSFNVHHTKDKMSIVKYIDFENERALICCEKFNWP